MLLRPPSPAVPSQSKGAPESPRLTTPAKSGRKKFPLQEASNVTPDKRKIAKEPRKDKTVELGISCDEVINTTECRCLVAVGKRVWAAERDGSVSIRDSTTAEVIHTIPCQETFCWSLIYCEDRVWTGWSTGHIRVYNPQTFELVREIFQHSGGVYCFAHSPGRLYSGSNDFEIFQWNTQTYDFIRQFSGHKNSVRCMTVYSHLLISGSDDYTLRIWDTLTADVRELTGHKGGVLAVARHENHLWSSAEDGLIKVWSLQTGECLATKADHKGRVTTLLLIGDRIWSAGVDKSIYIHSTEMPFVCLGVFSDHKGYINNVSVIGEVFKYKVWSCSSDKTLRVWGAEAGAKLERVEVVPAIEEEKFHALRREAGNLKEELENANQLHKKTIEELQAKYQGALSDLERCKKSEEQAAELLRVQNKDHAQIFDMQEEIRRLKNMLQDKDSIIEANKRERAAIEDKFQQIIRRKDEGLQEKEQEIIKLKHMLTDRDYRNGELQGQAAHKDKIIQELEAKIVALNSCIEDNNRTISDLHRQLEKLKQEGLQQDRELRRAAESREQLHCETDKTRREIDEWRKRYEAEREITSGLRDKLQASEALCARLREQLRQLEEDVKQREAVITTRERELIDKQQAVELMEREREDHQKKLAEFEFVIQSRSELVRQIWELFCEISESKKAASVVAASPELKRLRSESVSHDTAAAIESIKLAKDRCRRIVSNFFTEVEKFHVGTSPYYFPPDGDAYKYKFNEQNIDALKKFAANDLRRAGTLCYARGEAEKGEKIDKKEAKEPKEEPLKEAQPSGRRSTSPPKPFLAKDRSTSPPPPPPSLDGSVPSYMSSTASSRKYSRTTPVPPSGNLRRPEVVCKAPAGEKAVSKRWM
eukprot:TRINITY_DN1457_c0_g1_i1.p1 TRINITY_DN1457_c0_g1~~TRINITY_DN1457_c0_g1_i1.p1  ORF type:complete len:878 (+),score=198.37 TRINITY_DN1457_c0_g1_i1:1947-4580(+)